jgi:DNA-binding NarL/FixJ family response regulator
VAGTAADGHALLQQVASLHPHLVLLDVAMPLLNGLDAGQRIKHKMPDVKIIFVTMHHDVDLIAEAFRRGASGYLPKTAAAEELLQAVREVLNFRMYLSPALAAGTIRSLLGHSEEIRNPVALTGRQREVLQLLAEGKQMKEVASP